MPNRKEIFSQDSFGSALEWLGEQMPGGFFIYRASDEEILYINKPALHIFGCERVEQFAEITGNTFKGMVYPEDYESIRNSINEQIQKNSIGKLDYVEYRIVRRDGAIRWLEDYGHYHDNGESGGVYYVFISDITEKREQFEMVQDVREQQDRMITALASDYRSVYHIDLDQNDAVCYREDPTDSHQTPAGEHFPYYERFVLYAQKVVDEKYREEFLNFIKPENIRQSLLTEPIIAYRYLAHRDGKDYYEMIRMAGVRHPADRDDNIVHAVGLGMTVIDTEMRAAMASKQAIVDALAAAEAANKAKTVFLSNMSHEIRTPMNAIIGLNTLALMDESLSEGTREQLLKIDESARHLLTLINDILDMSRIESGRMALKKEDFSLREILEQITNMMQAHCRDKGLTFECRFSENLGDRYIGDAMKIKQVLINILSNAIKFTEVPGTVSFTAQRVAAFKNQSTLRFTVKDTGVGMDEAFLEHIFEPFTQEESSRSNKFGSTGLGMAITKNIVDMLNGTITVESEKGVGSTFTVTITMRDSQSESTGAPAAEKSAAPESAQGAQVSVLAGKRVLLAEDMIINAEIMKQILGMWEMEVNYVEHGKAALDAFRESAEGYFDVVLMDVRMPVMDGLEATKAIRALEREDAGRVPIIALTANAFDEDVKRSLQAGMNAHLSKPVEFEQLKATLESFLKQ
ncbi:MAG: response regulator [Clostridia bacterium]|nr:response regulator [Clostridia bacterium]